MLSLKLTGISLVVFWHFILTILEMRVRETGWAWWRVSGAADVTGAAAEMAADSKRAFELLSAVGADLPASKRDSLWSAARALSRSLCLAPFLLLCWLGWGPW